MAELVSDAIVGRLRAWDVQRVYGYAGDGINPILGALQRAGDPEFISTRHEELAAFAACGHAKFNGGVGVCVATQGSGAIHLLAGLYDAKLDRKPVVAIVGQVISTALGSGYLQEVDLHALFKDVCGQYVQTVFAPESALMAVDNAMRTAIATSTPTCLIVPHDVQQAQMPEQPQHSHGIVESAPITGHARPALPADDELRRAAEVIDAGRRVAVLVGRGAAGAEAEIAALVDTVGAGVTCSLLGKPVLDEDAPWHTGVMGHLGTDASAQLMANCDTLVVIGSNDPWTEFYPAPDQARAVQVDIQPRVIGSKYPVEVPLVGSARETVAALVPLLNRRPDRGWHDTVVRWKRDWQDTAWRRASMPAPHTNPELVIRTLSRHLPRNARLAVDVGSVTYWYARHLRLPPGVPAHVSGYLASMGCAMPYGLAAKLDAPDRPVVALVGDGAMQMSGLLDLISVADRWREWADPRFVILVLHNGDLAEVSWEQREMEGNPRFTASQRVPSFPYAGYAELLGLAGARVTESAQVSAAWEQAFAADRPFVLEAVVDASTPMLPPQLPNAARGRIISALERETDGEYAQQRVRQESTDGYVR
ncbi:thiamine pyrophosphate-requiring protein [Mycolicibacterium sp. J2]|uniref:thiamine pyrophosphate-requiring protein n=1 Tax=Mycolicibacterium sp. J2 TaxID=2993511 RepID=UPI00224B7647|nr:thiamine pyrophosphate-requiring protein [Mycolicibacterium sp. J2]MCX2712851.1 thiamine pyrophosphate-requiring protein [Mycolicibacterium sp. J2]